jgi:hypothetical protein
VAGHDEITRLGAARAVKHTSMFWSLGRPRQSDALGAGSDSSLTARADGSAEKLFAPKAKVGPLKPLKMLAHCSS